MNTRINNCFSGVVLLALCTISGFLNAADAGRPNFVFILADDLGYGDLGCYGREDIRTPNLDRLARQGVRFTNHYANGAECTPTRAAFLTGRYQQWIGGLECAIGSGNVGRYDDAIRLRETNDLGLPAEEPTIGQLLKKAGYTTAICGKWHLGYEPKFSPNHHGFEHAFYCIGGLMDYFHFLDNVAGYNLFLDGRPVSRDGYFTDLMTDDAIQFIKQQGSRTPDTAKRDTAKRDTAKRDTAKRDTRSHFSCTYRTPVRIRPSKDRTIAKTTRCHSIRRCGIRARHRHKLTSP